MALTDAQKFAIENQIKAVNSLHSWINTNLPAICEHVRKTVKFTSAGNLYAKQLAEFRALFDSLAENENAYVSGGKNDFSGKRIVKVELKTRYNQTMPDKNGCCIGGYYKVGEFYLYHDDESYYARDKNLPLPTDGSLATIESAYEQIAELEKQKRLIDNAISTIKTDANFYYYTNE